MLPLGKPQALRVFICGGPYPFIFGHLQGPTTPFNDCRDPFCMIYGMIRESLPKLTLNSKCEFAGACRHPKDALPPIIMEKWLCLLCNSRYLSHIAIFQ